MNENKLGMLKRTNRTMTRSICEVDGQKEERIC